MRFGTSRRLTLLAVLPLSLRLPAHGATPRVKGAAELDAEFYVRGLLGQPTAPAVEMAPLAEARRMDAAFVNRSLGALETTVASALSVSPAQLRMQALSRRRGLLIEYNKVLASGAFGREGYASDVTPSATISSFSSSATLDAADQYSFDVALLSYFTCLADARLPRQASDETRRKLGTALLLLVQVPATRSAAESTENAAPKCSELVEGMRLLLDRLREVGYLGSFKIDDSDVDDALWQQGSSLSATRLTISLRDSASLRSAIVLNGRTCSSELARPLLTSWLNERGVTVSQASEAFVDSTYRPNPLEYRPDEQVLELTIEPARR